uniref:Replication factor C subunit 1 n=1 Tax=Theileria annulata TaxID=5874 RepID=A0A3B0MZE1_THEAN
MDIRSFFAKANTSNTNTNSNTTNSTGKVGKNKGEDAKSPKNEKDDKLKEPVESKEDENKNIEFDEFEFLNKTKRSLKRRIIYSSDSDSNSDETPQKIVSNPNSPKPDLIDASEKVQPVPEEQIKDVEQQMNDDSEAKNKEEDYEEVKSALGTIVERLKAEIVEESTNSNLQTDNQSLSNYENDTTDPPAVVSDKNHQNVNMDINTYLDTISMPKTPPETPSKPCKSSSNNSVYTISSNDSNTVSPINNTIDTINNTLLKDSGSTTPKTIIKVIKTFSPDKKKENVPMIPLFSSDSSPTVVSIPSDSSNSPVTTVTNTNDNTDDNTTIVNNVNKDRDVVNSESSVGGIEGKKFVFTGEMSIDRLEATFRVKKLGGIVVSAVSGVTNYLVYGEKLEDGRPYQSGVKYKKALELNSKKNLNIQLLNEQQFLQLLQSNTDSTVDTSSTVENTDNTSSIVEDVENQEKNSVDVVEKDGMMLFDKYKPKGLVDVIGNPRQIERLKDWLKHFSKDKAKDEFKAALLSGPPGIGKTTCAKLVGQFYNYHVIEFNASDQRTKNSIERISPLVTGTLTLNTFGTPSSTDTNSVNHVDLNAKTLLILDEVDGMSTGDKGGLQAISDLIDITKCPIILICNDRLSQKMSALSNKCLDLRFTSPPIDLYMKRMNEICKLERIQVTENLLLELYHKSNGDLRYALNYLQFYNLNTNIANSINKKDESHFQNLFDNCNKIFHLAKMPFNERINKVNDLFFTDYSLMSLMLQENYFKYTSNVTLLSKLSLIYVYGDIVNTVMARINNSGSLLKEKLSFPQWLGKFSTTNKNKRLLGDISRNLCRKTSLYGYNLVTDGYLNILYQIMMKKLIDADLVECVEYMNEMGITRDMLVEHISSLRLKNEENLYVKVPTPVKTKLTRLFSSQIMKTSTAKRKLKPQSIDVEGSVYVKSDDGLDSQDLNSKKLKPTRKLKKAKK